MNSVKIWLKNNVEPFEDVVAKWNSSYPLRRKEALTGSKYFIIEWPLFKHSTLARKMV